MQLEYKQNKDSKIVNIIQHEYFFQMYTQLFATLWSGGLRQSRQF